MRVGIEGNLEYKLYRKLQKKNITLHYKSHHPLKTKIEVIKNFYRAAEMSSSSLEYAEESFQVVHHLLRCNGYTNPRQMQLTRMTGLGMPKNTSNVMLKHFKCHVKTALHIRACIKGNTQIHQKAKTTDFSSFYSG